MFEKLLIRLKLIQFVTYTLPISKDKFLTNLKSNIEIEDIGFIEELGQNYKPIKFEYKGLIEKDSFKIRKYNIPTLSPINYEFQTIHIIVYCNCTEKDGNIEIDCEFDATTTFYLLVTFCILTILIAFTIFALIENSLVILLFNIVPLFMLFVFYFGSLFEIYKSKKDLLVFFKEINKL